MSPASTCIWRPTHPRGREDHASRRRNHGVDLACGRLKPNVSMEAQSARSLRRPQMRMADNWKSSEVVAIALILAPAASREQLVETSVQPISEANWSATAGRTAGTGNSVLQAEAGWPGIGLQDRKSTRLNSSHSQSRMPSSA